MTLPQVTFADVNRRRLERHGLTAPLTDASYADVAAVLCGAHAQIAYAGEVSIALRLPGATRADVQRALWQDHTLVRTIGPRGTVHLLAAEELATWCAALGTVPLPQNGTHPDVRYDEAQSEELLVAICRVLAGGELTFDELTEALVDTVGPWAAEPAIDAFQQEMPRWRQLTRRAAYRGALVYGPNRGRKATVTNPRRWWPAFEPADPDVALDTVVTRYLHAYGPATPHQFARWLSAPVTSAQDRFARLGDRLQQVHLDGSLAWCNAGDHAAAGAPPPPGVRLLPFFDAFGVGSYPREALFPGAAAARALANGQAGNFPLLLVNGVVAGVWHQRRHGRRLELTVEPLRPLSRRRRSELDDEAERLATIQGSDIELTIGAIDVGAHA